MDVDDKIEFKKDYGRDKYLIINKYNLWNLDHYILNKLGYAVCSYLFNRCFSEREKIFSNSEEHYVDILGLKNLDVESLSDLDKAISYLIFFRMERFENLEIFKEKLPRIKT